MKATWKIFKHSIKQPCKFSNIGKSQYMGNDVTETEIIAEVCNGHFVTISKKLADETFHTGDSSPYAHHKRPDIRFKFKPVKANQIQLTISNLRNSNTTGIHNILKKIPVSYRGSLR